MKIQHLTDQQFSELLAGTKNDAWAEMHVESCPDCRDELRDVSAAVGDLNVASLRWAERRAVRIETPSKWALNWSALPGWGATMAGVLVVGVALGAHLENRQQTAVVRPPARAVEPAPSDDELAQDNSLLRSIDSELSEQVGAQVASVGPVSMSHPMHRHAIREVVN